MNQILDTGDNGKKSKKKNKVKNKINIRSTGEKADIKTVVKFFTITLILFGIFMIGSGTYGWYKNGKTNEEIEAERAKAVEEAKAVLNDDVEVIDSFFKDAPVDARPLWFLGKSIELLSVADAAYFAKDWDKYRGCKIEHSCAVEYGIKVIEYVEG